MIRTIIKRDLDSGGGLQTSGKLRLTDGGSVKPLGDLTHLALCGFYNAPYCKAVVYEKQRERSAPVLFYGSRERGARVVTLLNDILLVILLSDIPICCHGLAVFGALRWAHC